MHLQNSLLIFMFFLFVIFAVSQQPIFNRFHLLHVILKANCHFNLAVLVQYCIPRFNIGQILYSKICISTEIESLFICAFVYSFINIYFHLYTNNHTMKCKEEKTYSYICIILCKRK